MTSKYIKLLRYLFACVLLGSGLTIVAAPVPIQSLTIINNPNGDQTPIIDTPSAPNGGGVFDDEADEWDVSFTGTDQDISQVEVANEDYEFVTLADELRLVRIDNPAVTGVRDLVFCSGTANDAAKTIACQGSTLATMEVILLGRSVNFGTDNIFTNTTGNSNNIERVDYIYKTGIEIPVDPNDIGFIVLERGGNDPVDIAAITSVDAGFSPTGYEQLVEVPTSAWGASGTSYVSVVFRRDPGDADYRPSAALGPNPQNVEGFFVSFADLGLAQGETFFGYSLFPADTEIGDDLVNLSDADTQSPSNVTGLDLIEGGGFFQRTGGTLVDLELKKTTATPTPAANSTVSFTLTVNNLTQSNTVVAAEVFDDLPGQFSNIRWTCEAFVTGSTCLGGTQVANGSPSLLQNEADNTIEDVVNIAVGGSVVYEVLADLGPAAGVIENTASVSAASPQVEISSTNNADSAAITVAGPASGSKALYFLTDPAGARRELSRIPGQNNGDRERVNDGAVETWVTDPDFAAPVTVSGASPFTLELALRTQGGDGSRTINFDIYKVLNNGAGAETLLATAQIIADLTNGTTSYEAADSYTLEVPPGFTIEANAQLEVRVAPQDPTGNIHLYEAASATQFSRLTFSPDPVINVDSLTFNPASPEPGDTLTVTAVVSDPFGDYDITDVDITLRDAQNQVVQNDIDMTPQADANPATATFTSTYDIPGFATSLGDWSATVTATEGLEAVPVEHSVTGIVTVGVQQLPEITVDKLVNGLPAVDLATDDEPTFLMTFTHTGQGDAEDVIVTIDIDPSLSFGVDLQAGAPFVFTDTSAGNAGPALPTNFYSASSVEISVNDGPFMALSGSGYVSDITAIRIPMQGIMEPLSQFTLQYQCLVE